MIRESISKVVRGEDLTEAEMEKSMDEIMTGAATPAQIGAFITALRLKGETVDEITGAAPVIISSMAVSISASVRSSPKTTFEINSRIII